MKQTNKHWIAISKLEIWKLSRILSWVFCLLILTNMFFLMCSAPSYAGTDNGITSAMIEDIYNKYNYQQHGTNYWVYNEKKELANHPEYKNNPRGLADHLGYRGSNDSTYNTNNHPGSGKTLSYRCGNKEYHTECLGFANFIGLELTGSIPIDEINGKIVYGSGWKKYTKDEIAASGGLQVGDIIRTGNHSAVVYKIDSKGKFTVAQCYGSQQNKIFLGNGFNGVTHTLASLSKSINYILRYQNKVSSNTFANYTHLMHLSGTYKTNYPTTSYTHKYPYESSEKVDTLNKGDSVEVVRIVLNDPAVSGAPAPNVWCELKNGSYYYFPNLELIQASVPGITSVTQPKASVALGKPVNLDGIIDSKTSIYSVRACVQQNGIVVNGFNRSVNLGGARYFKIAGSALDTGLVFNNLPAGNYTYKIFCTLGTVSGSTMAAGETYELHSIDFTVGSGSTSGVVVRAASNSSEGTVPTLPTGTLRVGQGFNITGTILSTEAITELTSSVIDVFTGEAVEHIRPVIVTCNASNDVKRYDIGNSILNTGLPIGSLEDGQYRYELNVMTKSGYSTVVLSSSFSVGTGTLFTKTDVTYPSGNLKKGAIFGLHGTVSCNNPISKVTASVIDANDNEPVEFISKNPTTVDVGGKKSLSLKSSAINNDITFNTLPDGTYIYILTGKTTTGVEKEIIRSEFTIGKGTLVQEVYIFCDPDGSDYNGDDITYVYDFNSNDPSIFDGFVCADVYPYTATNRTVQWSSSNTNVLRFNSSELTGDFNYGYYTVTGPGRTKITARALDGSGVISWCYFDISAAEYDVYPDSVSAAALTLAVGDSATLGYTLSPSNVTKNIPYWSIVSNPNNVISLTDSVSGTITANRAGTATLRITLATANGSISNTMTVTVQNSATSAVRIDTSKEFVVPGALHKLGDGKGLRATIIASGVTLSKMYGYTNSLDASGNVISNVQTVSDNASGTSYVINSSNKINNGLTFNNTTKYPVGYYDYVLKASYAINKHNVTTVVHRSLFSVYSGTASKITALTLTPSAVRVKEGNVITVTTEFTPTSPSSKLMTNAVGNPSILSVSETDVANHKYSLTGKSVGTTTFSLAAQDGSGKTASVSIEVYPQCVTSISLNRTTATMTGKKGTTLQLTASYLPAACDDPGYTWTSSDPSTATITNGLVAVAADVSGTDRTVTITAAAKDGSGKTATCTITVTAVSIPVTAVTLSKASLTLNNGATETLIATVSPSNATNKTVSWSTSNSAVATVNTATGQVTAMGPGTAKITATVQDSSGKKAECTVTVRQPVIHIDLSPNSVRLKAGNTRVLTATVTPSNASDSTIVWTSDAPSIATVSNNGTVTAVAPGKAVIIAAANDGSGVKAICAVTVYPAQVTSIAFVKDSYSVNGSVGSQVQLTLTYESSDCDMPGYTFESSAPTLLTVDASGLATVTASIADTDESVTVTATANDGSGATAQTTVILSPSVIYPISISMTDSFILYKGETAYPDVTFTPANATVTGITWSKNDPDNLIRLDGKGRITRTGGNGTCTVTATAATATGTVSATTTITLSSETGTNAELHVANGVVPSGLHGQGMSFSFGGLMSTDGIIHSYTVYIRRNAGLSNLESGTAQLITVGEQVNGTQADISAINNRIDFTDTSRFVVGHYNFYIGCSFTVNGVRKVRNELASIFNICAGQPVMMTDITVAPAPVRVKLGETKDIVLTILPADASTSYLNLSVTDPAVASVSVKNSNAFTYTVTGITTGMTMLMLAPDDGSGLVVTVPVTVYPAQVSEVTVTADSQVIEGRQGNTLQLTASFAPAECDEPGYVWTSSDETVTVSANGLVTVAQNLLSGQKTVVIKAIAQDSSEAAGEFALTVKGYAELNGIAIQSETDTLEGTVGVTLQLTAVPVPAEAELPGAIWASSNEALATVDENGLVTVRTMVTGENQTVTIMAEAMDYPDFTDTMTLTITPSTEVVASGMWGTCEWLIDQGGKLVIKAGTGENIQSSYTSPWSGYSSMITSVDASASIKLPEHSRCLFNAMSNCVHMDLSGLDTSEVTDMEHMFENCRSLRTLDLSSFDTSSVVTMGGMFYGCSELTELDLSHFNTENVSGAGMCSMFQGCRGLYKLDISSFDTSKATNMSWMFYDCLNLQELDVSGFDMSNVTHAESMFNYCRSLKNLDVEGFYMPKLQNAETMFAGIGVYSLDASNFDMSSATNTSGMFYNCFNLEQLNLGNWNTSRVKNMSMMFSNCSSLEELDITGLETDSASQMWSMFSGCTSLAELDVSGMSTENAVRMESMFANCHSLRELDVSNFDTSKATSIYGMFEGCSDLTYLRLSGWDVSSCTNMSSMFARCSSLISLNLQNWITSNATDMVSMFEDCTSLTFINLESFETSSVTDMHRMFYGCKNLSSLDVSSFQTNNVRRMDEMFSSCESLTSLDLTNFDTSAVINMSNMFTRCENIVKLDLSGFNTANVKNMTSMFWENHSLVSLDVSGFNTDNVTAGGFMFYGCDALKELIVGTGYSFLKCPVEYIDCTWRNSNGNIATTAELKQYDRQATRWSRIVPASIPTQAQKVIHLPSSLTDIEEYAFSGLGLDVVYIPGSVVCIDETAFIGNGGLVLVLPSTSPLIEWAYNWAMWNNASVVVQD